VDDYEEVKEKEREKLMGIEATHFTLLFLFDMLQFVF